MSIVGWLGSAIAVATNVQFPFSKIPADQREALGRRLDAYVKAHRANNWERLYDLVSDTGKGGIPRGKFVANMKSQHRLSFANFPDLLEFHPNRTEAGKSTGYDIYGCGKARREGMLFKGVAVVHAQFEHNDWFFTGWHFTEFPNEPCKTLSDPTWVPETPLRWDKPMEELQELPEDIPIPSTPQSR